MIFFYCILLLLVVYLALIITYWLSWKSIPELDISDDYRPDIFLSVIIPVRNEASNIVECLSSVLSNSYPKSSYEIIVVDDHSSDDTVTLAAGLRSRQINIIELKTQGSSGKKQALDFGIQKAKGEVIITLDGDCTVQREWLLKFAYVFEVLGRKCAVGTVKIVGNHSFLDNFQMLDVLASAGINGASANNKWHFAAYGANLGFTKHVFLESEGYKGNEHLLSGDDMFLVHKIAKRDPASVSFIKDADHSVRTIAEENWNDLLMQRKRWASKSNAYTDRILYAVMVFFFLANLGFILSLFLLFSGNINYRILGMAYIISKLLVDFLFLRDLAKYYGSSVYLKHYLLSALLFPLFYLVQAYYAISSAKFTWKDRFSGQVS